MLQLEHYLYQMKGKLILEIHHDMDNTNFPLNHDRKLRCYGGEKNWCDEGLGGKPLKIPHRFNL